MTGNGLGSVPLSAAAHRPLASAGHAPLIVLTMAQPGSTLPHLSQRAMVEGSTSDRLASASQVKRRRLAAPSAKASCVMAPCPPSQNVCAVLPCRSAPVTQTARLQHARPRPTGSRPAGQRIPCAIRQRFELWSCPAAATPFKWHCLDAFGCVYRRPEAGDDVDESGRIATTCAARPSAKQTRCERRREGLSVKSRRRRAPRSVLVSTGEERIVDE
jgi:hypothetical protein